MHTNSSPNTFDIQKMLRISLYSGILLVVVSMLFLGRDAETSPALIKIGLAVITPTLFYAIGIWVYRQLNAPLAAPGIVATGAWLVAVELIHFYDQRDLLPAFARDYYWLGTSLFGMAIITLTGHRARIWLLLPLVPLAQINAIASIMGAVGLGIAWWPVFAFLLVLAWWEAPLNDDEWRLVYRVSAVLFEVFLLVFSYWLPAQTANSMLITWATCALLVAVLGIRHGWVDFGPLALALLTLAVVWGLPANWWPPLWLGIAIGTIVFIERVARRETQTAARALELSTALAVLLSGVAALVAVILPFFGVTTIPIFTIITLLFSGGLMIWLGHRYALVTAEHAGLWLLAAGWAKLYFLGMPDDRAYGLWLSVLAVGALLVERVLLTAQRTKHKNVSSIQRAVIRWPLADLVVGLTAIIVIWTGVSVAAIPMTADPVLITITLMLVIGVWLVAGLVYRMPALIHVAVWLAPLAYALLLVLVFPPVRTLPMVGLAWMLLATTYLIIGHALRRHRPAMLAPFFIAGYGLLGFGLTLTVNNGMLLVVSLGWLVIVAFATSIAVTAGAHPAWTTLVTRLIPPDQRGYAFKHVHNLFVFITAWFGAIWLYLMLDIAQFPGPQQGIILVILSSAWIISGRILPRLPEMVGWPVYAAGWFMWLIGLLQVFFAPEEAMITAIFGLALCAEALYRSKALHWMPVFILQILFSVLQIAWMLQISGYSFLLAVTVCISLAGMWYDSQRSDPAGRITAVTGVLLSIGLWLLSVNPISTLGMVGLTIAALALYRRWEFFALLYISGAIMAWQFGLHDSWRALIIIGSSQLIAGVGLVVYYRPPTFRTLRVTLFAELDWATPLLWGGIACTMGGLALGWTSAPESAAFFTYTAGLIALTSLFTVFLRIPRLPYMPLSLTGLLWYQLAADIGSMNFYEVGDIIGMTGAALASLALLCQLPSAIAAYLPRPFAGMRWFVWWVKPLLYTGGFLAISSASLLLVASLYPMNATWLVLNAALLGLNTIVVFWKTRQRSWAWISLGLGWLTWMLLLDALHLSGIQWHTIPVGIALLVMARFVREFPAEATEFLAIDALLAGAAIDVLGQGILSLASILLALQLVLLAIYGYRARRVVPFASAILVVIGGGLWVMMLINLWLIPLTAGIGLLAGAVLLEVASDRLTTWIAFWQDWFNLSLPEPVPQDYLDANEPPEFVHVLREFKGAQPDQGKSSP